MFFSKMGDLNQIFNIRKPVGWTSYDVIRYLKRMSAHKIKIGHAGTLDPFAEGVLVVCTGNATKEIHHFVNAEKEYKAIIRLGIETDSLDISGKIVKTVTVPGLNQEKILSVLHAMSGEIVQEVPAFSALKHRGRKLYELARQNVEVSLPKRKVFIHRLRLNGFEKDRLYLEITCSKGTYIRSLARDIGEALGTTGFLQTLIRTRVGDHKLENARQVAEITV
ncbi:tRNA pseudouridine(55) synthase TruB [candidate division KSB1 bacterium]|nr:tRNA pseudouridine(55) synthase TruB [candidate division KSB1 bacterium]